MRNLTWRERREFDQERVLERQRQRWTIVIGLVFVVIGLIAGGPSR